MANTCCHVSLVSISELAGVIKAFKTRLERVTTPLSQYLGQPGSRVAAALLSMAKHADIEFGLGQVVVWMNDIEHYLRQAQASSDVQGDHVTLRQVLEEVWYDLCVSHSIC